ncbi:MAG: hypothetical protein HY343_08020 [Lentisphaerae bacterium]|nr:hypothetical protein [Lentisphaerota bacterium]
MANNFITDFPGGNGLRFEAVAPDCLRFAADPGGGPYTMWFHFRVEDPGCDVLRCEMVEAHRALCWPFAPQVRPVFRRADASAWRRVPPTESDRTADVFLFEVACRGQPTEIAFCHPYQLADWDRFFRRRLARRGARVVPLGSSAGGRPLFVCEFGTGRSVILLTARSHAGETPGSFVLEGLLERLMDADGDLAVRAIPFVDVDGVVTGAYGKDTPPVDFWMGWSGEPQHSEIRRYQEYLAALPQAPLIAVDCHAPTADRTHFIECSVGRNAAGGFAEGLRAIVRRIVRKSAQSPATEISADLTRSYPDWFHDDFERSLAGFLQKAHGTFAFTLEAAYHTTHRRATVGPRAWRELGGRVAAAIVEGAP